MSQSKSKEVDFDELRFIRVFTPLHIPKELIEQVNDRTYEVDDWFKYQELICMRQTDSGLQLNPLSMLYVIADKDNKVVGMLWCEVDALSKALVIQTFSMDKSYWMKGKAVSIVSIKAKEIAEECKLKKIIWCTNYPKHSERYGFKRAKSVLMEYTEKEDGRNIDGILKTHGGCSADDSAAAGLSISDSPGSGATSAASPTAVLATV